MVLQIYEYFLYFVIFRPIICLENIFFVSLHAKKLKDVLSEIN
jgi:hypothetical protein